MAQDVEIERGGDAERVIISGLQPYRILGKVNAQQQRGVMRADAAQKPHGLGGREIAERGARVEE